jgi:hypothetical protein
MADRLGVDTIDREGRLVVIKFRPQARIDPIRLVKVVGELPGATLIPPVTLKVDLEAAARPAVPPSAKPAPVAQRPPQRFGSSGRPLARPVAEPSSWWAKRATAGEVTSGFTKEEILKKPDTDPRAPRGVFAQLEGLFKALGS